MQDNAGADDLARAAGGAHRAVRAGLSARCRAKSRSPRSRARNFRPWTSSAWRGPPRPTPTASARSRERLVKAREPVRAGGALGPQSGDGPGAGAALRAASALPVAQSGLRAYQCFPLNHPLYMSGAQPQGRRRGARARRRHSLARRHQPAAGQRLGRDDRRRAGQAPHSDHGVHRRPAAHRRRAVGDRGAGGRGAQAHHAGRPASASPRARRNARRLPPSAASDLAEDAKSRASKTPIDPKWLSHRIGQGARRQLHRVRRDHRAEPVARLSAASRSPAPTSTIRHRAAAGRRARRSAPSSPRPTRT